MKHVLLVAACLPLGACSLVLGGRPETCGEYPAGGGPAVITTKDQQVCDVVRLRVGREIDFGGTLTRDDVGRLLELTPSWEGRPTIDALVLAVRRDAGDAVADEVRRAVDSVLARSSLPLPADCADSQRCLVKGAVRGVRIALLYAQVPDAPQTSGSARPSGE